MRSRTEGNGHLVTHACGDGVIPPAVQRPRATQMSGERRSARGQRRAGETRGRLAVGDKQTTMPCAREQQRWNSRCGDECHDRGRRECASLLHRWPRRRHERGGAARRPRGCLPTVSRFRRRRAVTARRSLRCGGRRAREDQAGHPSVATPGAEKAVVAAREEQREAGNQRRKARRSAAAEAIHVHIIISAEPSLMLS